jgi:hypothetical protein
VEVRGLPEGSETMAGRDPRRRSGPAPGDPQASTRLIGDGCFRSGSTDISWHRRTSVFVACECHQLRRFSYFQTSTATNLSSQYGWCFLLT